MKVRITPYGLDSQRHYEELRAAGVSDADASQQSRSLEMDWPAEIRLPVIGDSLQVDWIRGRVTGVHIEFAFWEDDEEGGADGRWWASIKLGQ